MFKQKRTQRLLLFLLLAFLKSFSQITAVPASGCAPLSVVFSGPAGASSILWNLGSGQGTSTLTSPNPLYSTAGTYVITYTAIIGSSPVSYSTQLVVGQGFSANFSFVVPPSHCAPMTVNFTASGGPPNVIYSWAFGDLSAIITGPGVAHTYTFANNFVPIVTAYDPGGNCTVLAANNSGTIHVSTKPSTLIISSNGYAGCVPPFTTNINGSGSTSGSPIPGGTLSFNWNFSGGSPATSNAANPGLVSFGLGASVISLLVTDNNQCSNSGTVGVSVVNPTLTATIPPTVCLNAAVPGTVNTSQSIAFFDIQSLGLFNFTTTPNIPRLIDTVCIFTTPGTKTMNISVQAFLGCPQLSIQKTVFVEEVIPNFTYTPPNLSCASPMIASFINLSSTNTSASLTFTWLSAWDLNASIGVSPITTVIPNMSNATFTLHQGSLNPYTIYTVFSPTIVLIAESNSSAHCKVKVFYWNFDTLIRPTAFFNVDKRQGCAPLVVQFKDSSYTSASNHIMSYTWCNGATPPVYVSGNTPLPPSSMAYHIPSQTFTYTNPGTYYPYLVMNTLFGCTDTSFVDTVIVVNPPTVSATFPTSVCAGVPVTINMTGTGTNVPSSSGIDHWHVDTDSSFFSGCVNNSSPSFAFTHLGTHSVIVTAYQANCSASATMVPTIQINGPVGKFQFETNCLNKKSVTFTVQLQQASTATLSFGQSPTSAQLILTGNPNGNTNSVITHVYASSGDSIVKLTSYNNVTGCTYTFSQTVKIRQPHADMKFNALPFPTLPNAMACVNDMYRFTADATEAKVECGRGYAWILKAPGSPGYTTHVLDLAVQGFSTTFVVHPIIPFPYSDTTFIIVDKVALDTFRVAGIYTITLIVKDENSCLDTNTKLFRISDAAPVFTFASNPMCKSTGPVQIINTTQASQIFPDVIATYSWSYGDGTSSTSTNPIDNPTHSYVNVIPPSQIFSVICTATNAPIGCVGKTSHTVQINNPYPGFNADNLFPCVPLGGAGAVNFHANAGYATYSLSYGNPPTAPTWTTFNGSFNGALYAYNFPGTYTPTLTVIDNVGCAATQTLTVKAIGQPTAVIKFKDDHSSFCSKSATTTIYSIPNINITPLSSSNWIVLGIPATADSIPPSFPPGKHIVSLTVFADGHCPSTATAQVSVYNPTATPFAVEGKTTVCLGEPITVSIKDFNEDLYSWKWFFGDLVNQGLIYATAPNGTNNPTQAYIYTVLPTNSLNGFITIKLLYFPPINVPGCNPVDSIHIHVIKVDPDFKNQANIYSHCLNVSDTFTNTTLNPTKQNFESNWVFGDGSTFLNQPDSVIAAHTYTRIGTYNVVLTVKDTDYGCIGTTTKQMIIFPSPRASIIITPTLNCPGAPFTISGNGVPGVSGTLTGTLTSAVASQSIDLAPSNTFAVVDSAFVSTSYSLTVRDNNTCISEPVSFSVSIVPPAPTINWDTTVVIGQLAPLNAFIDKGFTYTWTPVVTNLNCETCILANPISNTTVNITYTVQVEDELRCSIVKNTYRVIVTPRVSLDVPTAFTPNGDGINDVIYPGGWGLRKLNYFRVFNRWGQLIFQSNDLSIGWDGVYQGVPQNIETYVYQVSAETYLDSQPTLTKSGTFKLIR